MNDIANHWQLFNQLLQGTINSNERYRLQLLLDNPDLLEVYLATITPAPDNTTTVSIHHYLKGIRKNHHQASSCA